MSEALYLYNSKDRAAEIFFDALKPFLSRARWELKADFAGALARRDGDSFTRLTQAMSGADAIVYAIGPRGAGVVQGEYEAGQVIQAAIEAKASGRAFNIVPALIGGATIDQIPPALRPQLVQMENLARGGSSVLAAVYEAIVGESLPKPAQEGKEPLLSKKDDVEAFCDFIGRKIEKRGLTIFVGPYATADVHGAASPGQVGDALLRGMSIDARITGALLTQPWMAVELARVVKDRDFDDVWKELCKYYESVSEQPLPLEECIAKLAALWLKFKPEADKVIEWNGLLLVTSDQHLRLEQALCAKQLRFGRLRYTTNGNLVYQRATPDQGGPKFEQVWEVSGSKSRSQGTLQGGSADRFESIMVVKLMDCVGCDGEHPPLTMSHYLQIAERRAPLPDKISRHLGRSPFVMLGGGLANPLVSLAFGIHFRPCFAGEDEARRYVALHPWTEVLQADELRQAEFQADTQHPDWPQYAFNLKRIDWPLKDLVNRLADQIEIETGR